MLEALARGGVETMLFVEPPTGEQLARYPSARAVGVAGTGRTMSPAEMDAALPEVFAALGRLAPKFVHYKVCSTFDSSPQIGSIGRAIDVGSHVFGNRFVPLVVGTPALQRFCVFGNLFARSGLDSPAYRLDRHPTMRRHPVTPMTEADLRAHLTQQTQRRIELVDVLTLDSGFTATKEAVERVTRDAGCVVLFDVLAEAHLAAVGRVLFDAQEREEKPLFVAGSSGVEYALNTQLDSKTSDSAAAVSPVDRVLVLSGSCSPVTERQIFRAVDSGFAEVAVAVADANHIVGLLESGRSVIVHTRSSEIDSRVLGAVLGELAFDVLRHCRVPRVAVVGGDTSGQVARALGIEALEYIGPLEPGAPLCRARCGEAAIDGLEMTFKGGQVGHDDFFQILLRGRREG